MKKLIFAALSAIVLAVAILAMPAQAQNTEQAVCIGSGGTWQVSDEGIGSCTSPDGRTVVGTIQQVANILIFIVGAISVIMVIIGGLRYVTSQGEQSSISSAKNTIIYALVGVAIALMAYAIVNFVLTSFG